FHLAPKGPYHLGVAAHTTLTDVQVASLQFQGGIGLDTADRRDIGFDHDGGHDLDNSPNHYGNGGQNRQLYGFALQPAVEGLPCQTPFGHPDQGRCLGQFILNLASQFYGTHHIVQHHEDPDDVHTAPYGPHPVHGDDPLDRLHKIPVYQGPVRVEVLPHQGLGEAGHIKGKGIEYDSQGPDPKMEVCQALGIQIGLEQLGHHPIDHPKGQEPVPGQCPHMNVGNDPVTEVGDGIDVLQG